MVIWSILTTVCLQFGHEVEQSDINLSRKREESVFIVFHEVKFSAFNSLFGLCHKLSRVPCEALSQLPARATKLTNQKISLSQNNKLSQVI